jgi:hypothetical protein
MAQFSRLCGQIYQSIVRTPLPYVKSRIDSGASVNKVTNCIRPPARSASCASRAAWGICAKAVLIVALAAKVPAEVVLAAAEVNLAAQVAAEVVELAAEVVELAAEVVEVDLAVAALWAPQCRMKDQIADLIELRGRRAHVVGSGSWHPSPRPPAEN